MDIISLNEAATANGRIEKFNANPDSNSGVLTQPKVIEAGETVTIKSGRQAILANTLIEGDLVVEAGGDVFVPAGAGFGALDQRIDTKLDKDFNSLPDKPTPVDTDNTVIQETDGTLKKLSWANLKATLLTYFDTFYSRKSAIFGIGQTWQDVTASRSVGVTYTNSTGKPIQISASFQVSNSVGEVNILIDGVRTSHQGLQSATSINNKFTAVAIIPNGSTYQINTVSQQNYIFWFELR